MELENRYKALEEDPNNSNDVTDLNDNIITPLTETAKKYQTKAVSEKEKFSEETRDLMKKRKNLKTPTTAREKIEAAELNKTIRKKQRNDHRKKITDTITEIVLTYLLNPGGRSGGREVEKGRRGGGGSKERRGGGREEGRKRGT